VYGGERSLAFELITATYIHLRRRNIYSLEEKKIMLSEQGVCVLKAPRVTNRQSFPVGFVQKKEMNISVFFTPYIKNKSALRTCVCIDCSCLF